jgi:hypothetical protein
VVELWNQCCGSLDRDRSYRQGNVEESDLPSESHGKAEEGGLFSELHGNVERDSFADRFSAPNGRRCKKRAARARESAHRP